MLQPKGDKMDESIKKKIENDINSNKIMVYMKGTPQSPECGFSKSIADVLTLHDAPYHFCNILENPEIRQGIKEYSDWPTIPQVYVNGEFIGGCDVVLDLHNTGELKKILAGVK